MKPIKITLKEDTPDLEYTRLCNLAEKQGIFMTCGSPENKYIILNFENEIDFLAWCCANNIIKLVNDGI